MKKYIALAGLLLLTGCAVNNQYADRQAAPRPAPMVTPARTAALNPTVTRASSIATPGARKPSFSAKQINPVQGADTSQFNQQVLQLVNQQRTAAGLGPLAMDGNLSNMALVKAQDMYNNHYFDHNSPTYGSPFDMMRQFGIVYNAAGENIAMGQTSPQQVMNDWMNSEGHRANILNRSFTKIGIAYFNGEWVQEFTG
nr:CAP domain-containing protein [Cohnella sp. YIM B05605]